jgi:hypothetical protein
VHGVLWAVAVPGATSDALANTANKKLDPAAHFRRTEPVAVRGAPKPSDRRQPLTSRPTPKAFRGRSDCLCWSEYLIVLLLG